MLGFQTVYGSLVYNIHGDTSLIAVTVVHTALLCLHRLDTALTMLIMKLQPGFRCSSLGSLDTEVLPCVCAVNVVILLDTGSGR